METGHEVVLKSQLRGTNKSVAVVGFAIGARVELTSPAKKRPGPGRRQERGKPDFVRRRDLALIDLYHRMSVFSTLR